MDDYKKFMVAPHKNNISNLPMVLIGIIAWLIPGGGHWLMGQKERGVIIFVGICTTFILGIMLGSIYIVDPKNGNVFWFSLQILSGAPAGLVYFLKGSGLSPLVLYGHGVDLGDLYTRLAGLLNFICILDAVYLSASNEVNTSAKKI